MSHHVDPELVAVLGFLPELDLADATTARAQVAALASGDPMASVPPGVEVVRRSVHAADGPAVDVVVFRPRGAATPAPGIVWCHGGGFVLGSADTDVRVPAGLAAALGAVVVSVDYRLAPEHPFPAPLDDCYAALVWAAGENDLGIDPERIALAGISAGAGLAAAAALRARDAGGPRVCFQALDSPVLDDRLVTPSARTSTDSPMWRRQNAIDSWRHYLGAHADPAAPPAYAAPARADDLTGLPPAYIAVASHDPLRDEGIAYAQRLTDAGVATELHLFPGTFHGSSGVLPQAAVSRRANDDYTAALGRALRVQDEEQA